MLFLESDRPLILEFPNGKVRLEPGKPLPFYEGEALKALAQAGTKIQLVPDPNFIDPPAEFEPGWEIVWKMGSREFKGKVLHIEWSNKILWCLVEHMRSYKWVSQAIINRFNSPRKGRR